MRLRLDSMCSSMEAHQAFVECLPTAVDLATDYLGNVIIQRIIEKGTEEMQLAITHALSPHLAAIGIHKNGTWVAQKLVDSARHPNQISAILDALKPYTCPLLLDPFGNYVIQGFLRFGAARNQFVFDSMVAKCVQLGHGRFGSRSIRTCLESPYAILRQQKRVGIDILSKCGAFSL
jgi:Pumilio-family RNA binding repeat